MCLRRLRWCVRKLLIFLVRRLRRWSPHTPYALRGAMLARTASAGKPERPDDRQPRGDGAMTEFGSNATAHDRLRDRLIELRDDALGRPETRRG
jgi:hypothetical protein